MKRKGINTIKHIGDFDSAATLPEEQPQNPDRISGFEAEGSSKVESYRDKGIANPSLSQSPLVDKGINREKKGTTTQNCSFCTLMHVETQHQQTNPPTYMIDGNLPLNRLPPVCP